MLRNLLAGAAGLLLALGSPAQGQALLQRACVTRAGGELLAHGICRVQVRRAGNQYVTVAHWPNGETIVYYFFGDGSGEIRINGKTYAMNWRNTTYEGTRMILIISGSVITVLSGSVY